jgi:hypothetical protein
MNHRTKFWRRHPLLELIFSIAWAGGWFAIVVVAIRNGGFNSRHGGGITIAKDPFMFWTTSATLLAIGIGGMSYNVVRIVRRERRKRDLMKIIRCTRS